MKSLVNVCKKIRNRISDDRGFSMVEIMIVVVIIAILSGLAATQFIGQLDNAKVKTTRIDINTFSTALDAYRLNNGNYPSTEDGLQKLLEAKLIKKKKGVLLDPWDNPYQYRFPGESDSSTYEIWSLGADKKEGGEGINADIKSWE